MNRKKFEETRELLCGRETYIVHNALQKAGEILNKYQALMDKFCPLKEGDFVRIACDIDFEKAHGWKGHSKSLQRGKTGRVTDVDYNRWKEDFHIGVELDEEEWYSTIDKKWYPCIDKGIFYFGASQLEKVNKDGTEEYDV